MNYQLSLRTFSSLFVLMASIPPAVAADDEPVGVQELAPVVVQGETYRNTATKTALKPEETPGSVTVIDRDALESHGGQSVNQALRYTPGVTSELRGGAVTRFDQYTVRGFQDTKTAYDGLILLDNGWNLVPQIDLFAVKAIEVFKGPASVLYGNQPPGGLVNLLAKQPSSMRYNEVGVVFGSHNLIQASSEFTGKIADLPLNYSVVALGRKQDGQARDSDLERYLFAPSVDWQLTQKTALNLNLYLQHDPSAGIYASLPARGTVYSNPNGRLPTDINPGDTNYNTYDRKIAMPGYKIIHQFNDQWSFLQNARFLDGDLFQKNTYNTGLAPDDRTLGRRAYRTDEDSHGITIDNQFTGKLSFGGMEHYLLLGVDYQKLKSNVHYDDAPTVPIDLYDPDNHLIQPGSLAFDSPFAYNANLDLEYQQLGYYVQDQVKVQKLVLIAGGRFDHYKGSEEGSKYGVQVDDDLSQRDFTGRVGALYEFDNGLSPYVTYSQSFQPLAGSDRQGRSFEPSEGSQWETGVKYTSPDRRTSVTLSGFTITKKHDITRDPNGGPYDLIQAGETRSRGIELEARTQPLPDLTVSFNGTLLNAEITKDNSGLKGKTPVWVAEKTASLWADYAVKTGPMAGTDWGAGVRYIGETQLDALNTDTVPDYALLDLSLRYDLSHLSSSLDGLIASVTGSNMFDKRYATCYDAQNCWFGEERTIRVGLRYIF